LLGSFYPVQTVTITSSDPVFITPKLKAALRRKNNLMHSGKIEETNALATKIGAAITKHNSIQLRHLGIRDGAKQLWDGVKKITGKPPNVVIPPQSNSYHSKHALRSNLHRFCVRSSHLQRYCDQTDPCNI
jgi:hypothetical protein